MASRTIIFIALEIFASLLCSSVKADCPDMQYRCVLLQNVTYNTKDGTYSKAGISIGVNAEGPQGSMSGEAGRDSSVTTTAKGTYIGSFHAGRCYKFLVGCFPEHCSGYVDPTTTCNKRFPQCAGVCEAECTKCCKGEAPPWMC
eukprot:jgi/Botrbrau1/21904/Bobra.0249s0032.1